MVVLGDGVRIGANCVLANCEVEADAVIQPFTHIDGEKLGVRVGRGALVGPFARLRPGAQLGAEVHIGNFVEVKNSTLAQGAKANHLAYLGDATVGERVNYGAGSITANYDGANKHRTVIEADVHIGSNCVLVAPVTIGAGGTVGGGSTITKSTAPGALSRAGSSLAGGLLRLFGGGGTARPRAWAMSPLRGSPIRSSRRHTASLIHSGSAPKARASGAIGPRVTRALRQPTRQHSRTATFRGRTERTRRPPGPGHRAG